MPTRSQAARGVRAVAKRSTASGARSAGRSSSSAAQPNITSIARFAKTSMPLRVRRNDPLRGGLEQRSQRAVVFLVAARLASILGPAALGDVEVESGEPRDSAVGVAVGSAPALDPCDSLRRAARSGTCAPTNPWWPTSGPRRAARARRGRSSSCTRGIHASGVAGSSGAKPYSVAESFVPVDLIGRGDPCPGAAGRRFEREAEPLFLLPQRRFGAGALDGVPGPFGDLANELDLSDAVHARGAS